MMVMKTAKRRNESSLKSFALFPKDKPCAIPQQACRKKKQARCSKLTFSLLLLLDEQSRSRVPC
jgi:hypothetical protein